MVQSPMLSCPLKQTNEIDWVRPLKNYIQQNYGDDPERYSQECATLNRLRQDMRGAGSDSATGRDLLYRYYGQLELLDLRFPVDENHIKISFTWFDAFTHKPTSQYSLAFEKASIIFNISAVLSCHAANQNRAEEVGIKTAYHSFQAAAGMFVYINENFLHAPSTDLSRETVKILINVMLAQGQEVFLEKQTADQKKPGFLAKLASQAAYLYGQAADGMQEMAPKAVLERAWLIVVQAKTALMASLAAYYQAVADDEAGSHGVAIARLQQADKQAAAALQWAKSFPSSPPPSCNLTADAGVRLTEIVKHQQATVQAKTAVLVKDNDFIYHQPVPPEAGLSPVAKLPAAKAIPVSELYQGEDIQRIIGPDIFQKLVPLSVTESASLYDEEKAKLVRAETEKVEVANGEMAASLDYLKLPASLNILQGAMDREMAVDEALRRWCEELAAAAPAALTPAFDELRDRKAQVMASLDHCSKQLDLEESVCEKMRSKNGADWSQQPSALINSTLRSDIRSYRDMVNEASVSDAKLLATLRQHEAGFDEMRSAGDSGEADVLFQRAMLSAAGGLASPSRSAAASEGTLLDEVDDEGQPSVSEQIAQVEEILKKLNLVKRERAQVLKDLKERVHNDDISNVLILNKKSIAGQESQLFEAELEKFRPHQNRLLQANHKQASLMKELTKTYGDLLQDKRVRSEQSRYEALTRQRNAVMARYKKIYDAFNDVQSGLAQAQTFYRDMAQTVDSLKQNVETFINNRRAEGAQLLAKIERERHNGAPEHDSRHGQPGKSIGESEGESESDKLRRLMERLSTNEDRPSSFGASLPPPQAYPTHLAQSPPPPPRPPSSSSSSLHQHQHHPYATPYSQYASPVSSYLSMQPYQQGAATPLSEGYNPMAYPYQTPISPPPVPPNPPYFTGTSTPVPLSSAGSASSVPRGYMPPPPPPPPVRPQQTTYPPATGGPHPSGPGGYAQSRPSYASGAPGQGQTSPNDPWAGLNAWK